MLIWQKVFGDSNFIINLYISLTIFMIQTCGKSFAYINGLLQTTVGQRAIKSNFFFQTADVEVYVIHISWDIITYPLEFYLPSHRWPIIYGFQLIYQKTNTKKWEQQLNWFVFGGSNSTSVYCEREVTNALQVHFLCIKPLIPFYLNCCWICYMFTVIFQSFGNK